MQRHRPRISINPARLSTCSAMSAWARPGINTLPHAHPYPRGSMLFRNAWTHMGPPGDHRMGMGSCVSQVCMTTHGPLHVLAYHQWAGWFHSRLGPCTHDKARTHMFSPESSIDAWADPCPAPLVLYRCSPSEFSGSRPVLFYTSCCHR